MNKPDVTKSLSDAVTAAVVAEAVKEAVKPATHAIDTAGEVLKAVAADHIGGGLGVGHGADLGAPVLVLDKTKKKKKKYSGGLKQFQRGELDIAKANRRLTNAIASGFNEYYSRDKSSSRKRRDGSIKDAVKNWSRGLSKALSKGAKVPSDIGDALNTKTVRRTVRQIARIFAPPFLR